MIELERHIEVLLLRHDCVILPGFGGFMTHHVEARYDETERLFLPPLRTVGFNPSLKMNDSLLVQSYIEVYDISYPEALRRLEDEIEEMRQRLANEGSYELRNIGTLSMDEEGNYQFEPCEAGILTPCLYGLNSFEMPLLSDEQVSAEPATNINETAKAEKAGQDLSDTSDTNSSWVAIEEESDGNRFIRLRVSVVRNIAAACIAIIAFFAVSTPLGNNTQMAGQGKIDTSILDKLFTGETSVNPSVPVARPVSANKPTPRKEKAETSPAKRDYYCIVLASKVTKANATDYVERLRAQGLKEARVLTGHGATKVVYGNYKNENEAYAQLRSLSDKDTFKEGWIFQVKGK